MQLIDYMDNSTPHYWVTLATLMPYVGNHGGVTIPYSFVEPRSQGGALRWRLKYYTREEDCGFGSPEQFTRW